jgi:hypothetical protein
VVTEPQSLEEELKEIQEEEAEAATVLSSTFIPRRIIQPRETGKTQIRFAEDIFTNRPVRSEDKPRKKKKKFSHGGGAPAASVKLQGGKPWLILMTKAKRPVPPGQTYPAADLHRLPSDRRQAGVGPSGAHLRGEV